jgi:chemotaxis methyl-accepting protein methylase
MLECRPEAGGADAAFERIRLLVRRRRGVDLGCYKRTYVQRRILARMRARRSSDTAAYARLLAGEPAEVGRLVGALSTKVTSFFRNPGLYAWLDRRVLPEILDTPAGRTVRIWSAGCATGEEAWSLAALLAAREPRPDATKVRVIGTDIDRDAIAFARRAEYPIAALRAVPTDLQRRCFTVEGRKGVFRPAARTEAFASFRVESLVDPPTAGAYDLVLCRNVLIYFDAARQQRLLASLARGLRPGGWLALGRVERISGAARESFDIVNARERVYRRH